MIVRIVKMSFEAERVPDFLDNFKRYKADIRGFEGCERLLLLRDRQDQSVFFTYSWWRSEEALEAYRHSQLFGELWAFTKSLFAAPAEAWSTEEIEALR